jgi:hypothetical protein
VTELPRTGENWFKTTVTKNVEFRSYLKPEHRGLIWKKDIHVSFLEEKWQQLLKSIPRLPPQLSFQIQVIVSDKNICRTVIDEDASTCVMSITCWKAISSPPLTESHNTLIAFNGSGFKPYDVLPSLPITLEGKTVNVEVEVFDAPLD